MQSSRGSGAVRGLALWGSSIGVALAGLLFVLPLEPGPNQAISGVALLAIFVLLQCAQVAAARRTSGIERGAWVAMITVDAVLFILFSTAQGTETYLPTRDRLPLVWILGPVAAFEGLVVLLILARRVTRDTNRVALAADAAWLGVAAQAVMWPAVGAPVLDARADGLTVATILTQGFLAAALAGLHGALVLRAAPGTRTAMMKLGGGIVTLRYTTVIFYAAWLGRGFDPGGPIDWILLVFTAAMVWTAAWGPEASRRVKGHNPGPRASLTASWIPSVIIVASLAAQGFRLDEQWAWLLAGAGAILIVRLSVELRLSGRLREQLHHQATTDPLTRLPNRTTLDTRIAEAGAALHAVMVIDLDRFKAVNDHLGHEVGDELLRQVAHRLGGVLGDDWLLSRTGGDEFVAVSTRPYSTARVEALAQRAIRVLEPTFLIRGREAWIGASIGIATMADGVASRELLAVADLALRHAKVAGRGEVVVSDHQIRARAVHARDLARALEQAVYQGEIFCLYQPRVDLGTGRLIGVEALVRWNHPTRGMLTPADFLDVAESTGLVARLDEAVLRRAAAQLAAWNAQFPGRRLGLSVNMSAWQLTRRDVDREVTRAIASAGREIDPAQITIELTETLLIDDPTVVRRRLEKLRSTGVSVSVDDFGSGFTSIAHLRQFPISEVKIDRSLTAELLPDRLDRSVAGAVIALARALDLDVVAEGVETETQADALRRLGCRSAQGFLFAPPVDAAQITEWLTSDGVPTPPNPVRPGVAPR